jgi:cytochrome c-type biogenesis protein
MSVTTLLLGYAAGLLTLINPCVLPLIPLIGAAALSRHRLAPLALAAGLVAGFTIAGLGVFALARALGLTQSDISIGAGLAMVVFGLVLVVPQAEAAFARMAGAAAGGGTRLVGRVEGRAGLWGEAAAGALLGLAWSPCIGPTLGAAIGLAAQGENLLEAGGTMLAFSAGAATVVVGLAYGARAAIGKRRETLAAIAPYAKKILGAGLIIVGLMLAFHLDRAIESWAVETLPAWFTDLSVSL